MADFKYIMQGFQKDINFFDEIKEVLETEDYTSIWILTALKMYVMILEISFRKKLIK